jgi:general secretion pathway protein D
MEKTSKNRVTNTAAMLMAAASVMPLVVTVANAGETGGVGEGGGQSVGQSALAQREIIRRQQLAREADEAFVAGRKAYAEADYEQAVAEYRNAIRLLPDAPALADRRSAYVQHLVNASVALSGQYRTQGKYDESRELLETVMSPGMDPDSVVAREELAKLDDPIHTNPALKFEHTQNIDLVRRTMYMGEGFYNLGKFDEAKREFEKVLRIDQHNTAARRWMERIASTKSDYYRAAYDQTRAELLMEVDRAWELAVPLDMPIGLPTEQAPMDTGGTSYILNKLRTIIIPRIDFENTTLDEAVDFLRQRARELDSTEQDPEKKGVNFAIRLGRAAAGSVPLEETGLPGATLGEAGPGAVVIPQLKLNNVPLATALKYITDATKMRYRVDDYAVTLVPATEPDEDLYNRSFRVPPDFPSALEAGSEGAAAGPVDPFAAPAAGGNTLRPRPPIQDLLAQRGVTFPAGASATFVAASSTLVVRNTPTNIDVIEQIVDSLTNLVPKQIRILTKFIEISQENNDELGFDWVITPFGFAGATVVGGGSTGNGTPRTNADFANVPGYFPLVTQNSRPVTFGNRSGDAAISRNNIDALLSNPNRGAQQSQVAPGIMSLTGLFNEGQVQVIMRGLAQKKGADVMNAPSVLARSGQKATIEIIREFIYPTEYDPPELPATVGGGFNNGGGGGGNNIPGVGLGQAPQGFPVTPATPTAWETRNVGVLLEIEPTLGQSDYVIDLRFAPEIVEFEGFINYGSPILAPGADALGNPVSVVITENRIEMPVFSTRKVNTALSIYDGHTVSVGGLMREDVQKVEDKVPILGDIPLIGRLFQTNSENRIKSNLIVFVTAQIIDATGRPLRASGSPDLLSTVAGGGVAPVQQPMPVIEGGVLPVR